MHLAVILNDHDKTTFVIQCENNGQYLIKKNNQVIFSTMAFLLDQTSNDNYKPISSFVNKIEETENKIVLNSMEIYKEFRIRGYDYGPDFRLIREANVDGHQFKVVFNGNWVTFLDSVMQINILDKKHHCLYLPVKLQSIRCDPTLFSKKFNNIGRYDREMIFTATQDRIRKIINVGHSIEIKQIDWNLTKIKHKHCTIEKYEFVPYISTISGNKFDQLFEMSTQLSLKVKEHLKHGHLSESASECCKEDNLIPNISEGLDKIYTLIEWLGYRHRSKCQLIRTLKDSFPINDIDFMVTDNIYSNEIVIRPLIDIVIENSSSFSFNVLELCSFGESCVSKSVQSVIECCYPQLETNYKLIVTNEQIRQQNDNSIETNNWTSFESNSTLLNYAHLNLYKPSITKMYFNDIDSIIQLMYDTCIDNGFAMLFTRTCLLPCEQLVYSLLNIETICVDNMETNLVDIATSKQFVVISKRKYSNLFSIVLLRKVGSDVSQRQLHVDITVNYYENWIERLKNKVEECLKTNKRHRIWLFANDSPLNGIIGLVNCLRKEPNGHRIRCLFIADNDTKFDEQFYSDIFAMDLVMNVVKDGQLGSFRYISCDQQLDNNIKDCPHAYIDVQTVGDLSSLKWFESEHKYWPIEKTFHQKLFHVYYSALNFRDIMLSTGKLSVNALPGDMAVQKCTLGLEFAGRNQSGRRVFGMVAAKALATTVVVKDSDFLWPIPDHWSMSDASTVPVAYCTAFYALVIRGRMKKGETVLIHSGSGAVGQAAIRIALKYGCYVYTTVGNQEKRHYLAHIFPKLKANSFANSRDNSFEDHVLRETNGRGVDLVLNSLSEGKLQASVRCLAYHGRFLEIGKYDMSMDNPLG